MTKKALLVGINDYAPVGAGGPDLRGCVNDVQDMANTLSVLDIVPASPTTMRILTDARATRGTIMSGLKWLTTGAKSGDLLIFHYSGHGSQVIDVEGDEPDGKDETICPHDFASAGMIKDDDLRQAFANLPAGVNLDVILDSCHSGSGTRELAALATTGDALSVSYRFVEPPIDWGFFLDANPSLPVRGILKPKKGVKDISIAAGLNHVLWAGCRDNQTSAEAAIGGIYRGVFTYNFCKVLRGAGVTITRKNLDSQVARNIKAMGYAQIPQLEGTSASCAQQAFT
ncbi:MAG: caspase family protein [Chlorobium sp.]|nr:MAG: caspase family protein [Chlorobium sp.]